MPNYLLEEISLAPNWEMKAYSFSEELYEQKEQEQEGLVYLFTQWLDYVKASDFGTDEGLERVFA